nr:FecR domain-containing protein [Sandaracinobacteroides sayramensis]
MLETASTSAPAGQLWAQTFATGRGQQATHDLPDGSRITLDAASRLRARFADGRRALFLEKGRVLFEVAHDGARPFVVTAGSRTITALGTRFTVSLDERRLRVFLAEGRVRIGAGEEEDSPSEASVILLPGQTFLSHPGELEITRSVEAKELLWREGLVEFDRTTLGEAVAEMNRYSARPILIDDARIAGLEISGLFRTSRPERFVALLSEVYPVQAVREGDRIHLVAKTAEPS